MSGTSSWPISGKILFIDDMYTDVEKPVFQLISKGVPVLFWDGKASPPDNIENIRTVIIDLKLAGQSRGPGFYVPAVKCLNKIPGPYIVIIVSVDFEDDDPSGLLTEYVDKFGTAPHGYIHNKGLSKSELSDLQNLANTIKSSLKERPIMNLVLVWENILDDSKDAVLGGLVLDKLEATVVGLIKTIYKDEGEDGAPRGFVHNLMRLQSRLMTSSKELARLRASLTEVIRTAKTPNIATDSLLDWILMYYAPDETEDPRTGDIYKIADTSGYKYSIVLTPTCDFAQEKASMILACTGCDLDEGFLIDDKHPLLTQDPEIANMEENLEMRRKAVVKKYLRGEKTISQRFYPLYHFRKQWDKAEYTGICFDLKNVHAFTAEQFKEMNWKRICRLDSPFIDLMLQRFGFYSSRMGQPDINKRPPY